MHQLYVHVCTSIHALFILVRTYIYIHTYTHTYKHTCMHTYIHACIHTYIHTYIHSCMHAYIHTYIQCMYVCMYVCTYIHTYIHTYIDVPGITSVYNGGYNNISINSRSNWPLFCYCSYAYMDKNIKKYHFYYIIILCLPCDTHWCIVYLGYL